MTLVRKFTIFFKVKLEKDEISSILKDFLDYFQKKENNLLFGISKPVKSFKGSWKVTISAKPENINYICRKFIDFLSKEDCSCANTKIIHVSVPHQAP